jgi:hypothetical protein
MLASELVLTAQPPLCYGSCVVPVPDSGERILVVARSHAQIQYLDFSYQCANAQFSITDIEAARQPRLHR